MPENSPFRSRSQKAKDRLLTRAAQNRDCVFAGAYRAAIVRVPLALLLCCLLLPAQVYKVDPHKTITFQIDGATAAYTLDGFFAEATAENGVVTVEGKVAGDTHVVVVTPSGTQTFEILVNLMPPVYPPGYLRRLQARSRPRVATTKGGIIPIPPKFRTRSTS